MDFFEFSAGENLVYDRSDCQYVEGSSDETNLKKSKEIKKTIKKYEPIVDNSVLYRYEDNPEEYKRMRKKQQNRESATRVRYRQKTHVDQMEYELNEMKQLNTQLQLTNAKLQAENTVLKQQLSFFQNLMQQNIAIEDPQMSGGSLFELERTPNQKRHFAFLTIMTAVICVIFVNQEEFGKAHDQVAMALQLNNTMSLSDSPYTAIPTQIETNIKADAVKLAAQYFVFACYLCYLCYVIIIWNPQRILKTKIKML